MFSLMNERATACIAGCEGRIPKEDVLVAAGQQGIRIKRVCKPMRKLLTRHISLLVYKLLIAQLQLPVLFWLEDFRAMVWQWTATYTEHSGSRLDLANNRQAMNNLSVTFHNPGQLDETTSISHLQNHTHRWTTCPPDRQYGFTAIVRELWWGIELG